MGKSILLVAAAVLLSVLSLLAYPEDIDRSQVIPPHSISVIYPVDKDLDVGSTLTLPAIAPGQTVRIDISPRVHYGGIHGNGGNYDLVVVHDLPLNWKSQPSKLNQNPLSVFVTVSPYATNGQYSSDLIMIDEDNAELLGNLTIPVMVEVQKDIVEVSTSKSFYVPARKNLTLVSSVRNKGYYPEVFNVSIYLAGEKKVEKQIYIEGGKTKTVTSVLSFAEPEFYSLRVDAVSVSSGFVADRQDVTVRVGHSLESDLKSLNNGVLVYPSGFMYSIVALLGSLI